MTLTFVSNREEIKKLIVQGRKNEIAHYDLSGIDLSGLDLSSTDLCGVALYNTNLSYADLRGADLRAADLRGADLHNADLSGANLCVANLAEANLEGVKYDENTSFFALQCPEEGSFIGFKNANGYIVKLEISANAKRSSATTRKCRCSKSKVLSITLLDGTDDGTTSVCSDYDPEFVYRVGETVKVDNFDENRWHECSTGIHFFLTREEAVRY